MADYIDKNLLAEATDIFRESGSRAAVDWVLSHGCETNIGAFKARMQRMGILTRATGGGPTARAWTSSELGILNDLYATRISQEDLMRKLDRSWSSIRFKAESLGIKRHMQMPTPPRPHLQVPSLSIHKPLLVLADLHVPYQHSQWLDRVLRLADAWGVNRCVLAGDAIDGQALSRFERHEEPTSREEIKAYGEVEERLLQQFDWIDWFMGNHEARWGKRLDWTLGLDETVMRLFSNNRDRVEVHNSYALEVNGQWRLEHPKSAAEKVAVNLAVRWGINVAVAHTHHASTMRDPSGRLFGICIGAGADHSRMPYCTYVSHGTRAMTNGALILVPGNDGVVRHYTLEPEMDLVAMERLYGGHPEEAETVIEE